MGSYGTHQLTDSGEEAEIAGRGMVHRDHVCAGRGSHGKAMADLAPGDVRSHMWIKELLPWCLRFPLLSPSPGYSWKELQGSSCVWAPVAVNPWDCHVGTDSFCLKAG